MATLTWSFDTSEEGWEQTDASLGNATATMAYDAVDKSLRNTFTYTGATGGDFAISHMFLDVLITIQNGDTLAADYVFADGKNMGVEVHCFYTDGTSESVAQSVGVDGTQTLTMTQNKTAEKLQVVFNRPGNVNGLGTFFPRLQEVRLTTAVSAGGTRPLEMDIDLSSGSKIWTTAWGADILVLREYSSNLVIQDTFSFGAATEAQVDARTFYISPYAPAFFGTSGLDDIIYVYGRWDDGAVTHIEKSTDGATSFTDIGDSATWLAGWVGAFFAVDANTLYALINGASRALYRSIDAGATWTNLSTLPFDVDPGGMTVHPDGRILISNRDTGSAMVAYAEAPDYSVWFDATGSPSFPTGGGGSNAVIWIT